MRRIAIVAIIATLACMAQSVVFAQDYITEAAQALQHASVYVAPDTEGTDKDTAGKLQARLSKDDNIVLVMLPASAATTLGADATTIAIRLSDELGNRRIIGLAVGNEVVGYAPYLPSGVAADQMRRAKSVSNDPVTALSTYAQNMHIWQAANPQPKPPPAPGSDEEGGLPWFFWVAVWVFCVITLVLVAGWLFRKKPNAERTSFKAPDPVKDQLAKIVRLRGQVNDVELRSKLYQMCEDIERYFQKSSKDKKRDSQIFVEYLKKATDVLEKYIEIQNSPPRYYHNPEDKLREGKESLIGFGEYVLKSIRRGTSVDLITYNIATDILQARRYD